MRETNPFECWAILEVMGHKRFAGYVSEQSVAGASFVRIDVPAVEYCGEQLPQFTKLLGPGSIYAITPCTEETARAFATQNGERAFATYEAPRLPAPESVVGVRRNGRHVDNYGEEIDDDDPYDPDDVGPNPFDATVYEDEEQG